MISLEQLKDACRMQRKVRDLEEEGMILHYEDVIPQMVRFGFIEYDEGFECLRLLGKIEATAHEYLLGQ